jgi:predicted dithiol-disulfide oxidoreductase (DUF899 family)
VVSHEEWLSANGIFEKEKDFTVTRRTQPVAARIAVEAVNKEYIFEGLNGKQTLAELLTDEAS